jgi:hypothetical protein
LQIDLRRRLSKGLQLQANYQFAKAFESARAAVPGTPQNSETARVGAPGNAQSSFRAPRTNILDTNTLRHSFKVSWAYELPIGRGKPLLGNASAWLNHLVGGWEFFGAGRVQSGQLFNFGNVNLVGMTNDELRDMVKIRHGVIVDLDGNPVLTNGRQTPATYFLPHDVIANTIRAFNASATSATGYSKDGSPTGRYIAPASNASCIQVYSGQCAPQNVFVTGPKFTRFDLSLKKQIRLTERFNFELRGEFLNAFNNINFFNPTGNAFITPSSQSFMQVTTAYQDLSNTNDPGGRLIQIVARFNF